MTKEEMIVLLDDADEQLRLAVQYQRGIGIDAGISEDEARQKTVESVNRALADIERLLPVSRKKTAGKRSRG